MGARTAVVSEQSISPIFRFISSIFTTKKIYSFVYIFIRSFNFRLFFRSHIFAMTHTNTMPANI